MTEQEWLQTNGIGGYASSTASGINTRRYHGLLVAAMKPPVGRVVLLSKLEETLVVAGARFQLSANHYAGGVVYPQGDRYLESFEADPFPVWTYVAGGVRVVRRLHLVQGENTVAVEYELDSADCTLEVRPLVAFRDFHALTQANGALNPELAVEGGLVSIEPYGDLPRLYFAHNAAELVRESDWYYRFDYAIERERGLEANEDLYHPFTLRFTGERAVVVASTEGARLAPGFLAGPGDLFIVRRGDFHSIIAGYHWFGDWGRDTMVALPGLTLVTGRADVARSILLEFAGSVSEGMLPNRFPDRGEPPEYNTVDATLWFFEAVRSYVQYTGDLAFVREHVYPVLRDIVDRHVRGTRFGIRVDEDGLLKTEAGQLTWMDTKNTPRRGKAVEVQALWHNALRIFEEMARSFRDERSRMQARDLAHWAEGSFNAKFWNEQERCLFDVIDGETRDASIRPNQILAVSLRHSMLPQDKAAMVLDVVERELLTPFGLRTLSPRDSQYRGLYEGGPESRDAAYHQGTVWPWLLGPFVDAHVKVRGRAGAAKFLRSFDGVTDGLIPEIFDGDAPHAPRGCIAQAWSFAEILRARRECKNS